MGKLFGAKTGSCIKHTCATCQSDFTSHSRISKYCKRKCYTNSRRKDTTGVCSECGTALINRKSNDKYYKRTFCGRKCAGKNRIRVVGPVMYWLGKKRPNVSECQRGSKGNNWQGGKTPQNKVIRFSAAYADWRHHVFQRDDYTCQSCGLRGGNLQADHIMPFAYFPDLRLEILNGRTLCVPCHKRTLTYGSRVKTYEVDTVDINYKCFI